MEWIKTNEKTPEENQKVEIPWNGDFNCIIPAIFSDKCFWSSLDGYHEPENWRPQQPERSKREDSVKEIFHEKSKDFDPIYLCDGVEIKD